MDMSKSQAVFIEGGVGIRVEVSSQTMREGCSQGCTVMVGVKNKRATAGTVKVLNEQTRVITDQIT
jgi:hypothetical protein